MTTVLKPGSVGGLQITTPGEMEANINMMIYGDPGVGKTVLAASAAELEEMSPVLIIDVEGGTLSLRKFYPGVDVVRIRNFQDFNTLYTDLKKNPRYKTIVLDSLTEIQKFGMYEVMKRSLAKASADGREKDPDMPEIGDWGKNIEQTRKIVRAFRDLPCNVIFTALAQTEKTRRGDTKSKPSLSGKLSGEVAGFLDIVVYMYKKTVDDELHRYILTAGNEELVAKDRTNALPVVMQEPTMAKINALMNPSPGQPEVEETPPPQIDSEVPVGEPQLEKAEFE